VKIRKPVLIVLGEPNSVFTEILSKILNFIINNQKIRYPIILIGSKNLIFSQLRLLRKKIHFEVINKKTFNYKKLKKKIYLIDVKYKFKKPFELISNKSKSYISNCFNIALNLINLKVSNILINGPISKKHFLKKKYPGVTEYLFNKSKIRISKEPTMLLFNKKISVSPITTHIPLKNVAKTINQKSIINKVLQIDAFYKANFNIVPKIALLGLNPHCESKTNDNEENIIIVPAIKKLKKKKLK